MQEIPEVASDGKIDLDKLKDILGDQVEENPERYNFTWHGKMQSMKLTQQPTTATLKPNKEKSRNWDKTQNLYIEGDNLEVLKILQKSYSNKVKLIYIDPPYNTGKDFVYKDNFHDSMENYLEQTGQVDEDGYKKSTNTETNGHYHTNWLNMMYPRLKLARNLLTDDGVIFISIDDTEQANLKNICDELFGESNFIATIPVINNLKGNQDQFAFAGSHEYVLCYVKDVSIVEFKGLPLSNEELKTWEMDDDGYFKKGANLKATGVNAPREKRPNLYFPIYISENKDISLTPKDKYEEVFPITDGKKMSWRWSKNRMERDLSDIIVDGKSGSFSIYKKQRPIDTEPSKKPKSFFYKPEYSSGNGTKEIIDIFGNKFFSYPKPISLIKDLITISSDKNSIILDFFSGSATTAQAVMQLNAEDSGKRKFIMVQLPEQLDKKSDAYKDGYRTIPDIAEERIRRAGDKIINENPLFNDKLDTGFKVFELDKSNIRKWNTDPDKLAEQLKLGENNLTDDSSTADLVYEIMLKQGLELTLPIEKESLAQADIYKIAYGALFIVLGANINVQVADRIIEIIKKEKLEDVSVVLQDTGFSKDSEKLNTIEILNAGGIQYDDILSI